ncbi:hypothetical protein BFF78_29665 [Streptomyces fodineus]|uniref:DUF2079 domain-containing protein n=1 Tax=Streptomyces fodineus TaxID=1904616 RepID=A0A1D7YGK6_9ACTN|nr:hypothetical protein BFF78_29665 [Streptomyces fodineus]
MFAVYVTLSVARYLTGNPASWDIGIFTEAVARYATGQAPVVPIKGMDVLGDHFSPVVAVLAPFFRAFPSPVTLLVAQAALAAASVVPVHRAAAELLTRGEARLITAAYGLSWGLSAMVWSDFHEVAFAVLLLACSLSALARRRAWPAVWWAAPLVWVKEDQGWTLAAIGLIIALAYRQRLAGALLAAWGAGWSLLAIWILIPAMNPNHAYPYWKDGSHHLGVLASGWETKGPLLALLLLPTAGLALRSPLVLAAVPALGLRLISSNPAYWGTDWHYNATAMPILFVAAVDGLHRLRAAGRPSWARGVSPWLAAHGPALMAAVGATMVFQSPLNQLWQPGTYRTPPHIQAAAHAERMIPSGQWVATSMGQLASLGARDEVCWLQCPAPPEWILLDQGPGTWWQGQIEPSTLTGHYPHTTYRTVFHADAVWLLERTGPA